AGFPGVAAHRQGEGGASARDRHPAGRAQVQRRIRADRVMSGFDELDLQILEILREDSRISNREVARRIGVPEGRVRSRIRKMLDDRAICFSLIMHPVVAGYKVSAYVRFAVEERHLQAAADYLCALE